MIKIFKKLFNWIKGWFKVRNLKYEFKNQTPKKDVYHFSSIIVTDKTPTNSVIQEKELIEVIFKDKPIWVLFKCPCGCGTVISLSLQQIHNPHWDLIETSSGRPTLYPSVWQRVGCMSHFWVKDGKVYWA